MAEEESGSQDKTEEPSARKLEKAAEDGQVLSSKEMFVFTTLIMGLMILTSIPFFLRDILSVWNLFFLFDLNFLENASPMIGIGKMIKQVIIITLIVGVPLVLTILVTQMAVGGINFAPKGFHFKSIYFMIIFDKDSKTRCLYMFLGLFSAIVGRKSDYRAKHP